MGACQVSHSRVSGIPTIKIISSQCNNKPAARAGVSEEGPRAQGPPGLLSPPQCERGKVWDHRLLPCLSVRSPGGHRSLGLAVPRVSSSWPLCLGSTSQSSACSSTAAAPRATSGNVFLNSSSQSDCTDVAIISAVQHNYINIRNVLCNGKFSWLRNNISQSDVIFWISQNGVG